MKKLRLGLFDCLESRPLAWSFLKGQHGDVFVPSRHRPGQIAELLERRQLEVALLPSIELTRFGDLAVVPDLCLGWQGSAFSIVLALRSPLEEVRRVAVPPESGWALALMQVALAERFALRPKIVAETVSAFARSDTCQAVLLTGRGLRDAPPKTEMVDLGSAWLELSGLPFIGAVWVARSDVSLPELPLYFKSALRYGLQSIDHLVRETAAEQGFAPVAGRSYLEEDLRFVLGAQEDAGLLDLLRRAHRDRLAPRHSPIPVWGEDRVLG